jgi:hypothetical protein
MMNDDIEDISFASKEFNPMIEDVEISDEEKKKLSIVFDYVVNVHDELVGNQEKSVAKKLYTETHFVSLIPYVNKAIESNINEAMFSEWLVNFFKTENNTETYAKYNEASSHGIAKNANVMARHEALNESYTEFFKE